MTVRVELYGVARTRAQTPVVNLRTESGRIPLGDALRQLQQQCPELTGDCIDEGRLTSAFVANVDGERFVRDPAEVLLEGQTLLILSADAGG